MDGVQTLRRLSSARSPSALQLTPLWEHVLRTRRVPADVDTAAVFAELGARLADPEWEVRQHAMRVLADLVPVLDGDRVDALMAPVVLPELVRNLGHSAPAVRKAALDTLRAHLRCSADPESVLRAVVAQGLEKSAGSSSNVAMGVILGIPSLVQAGGEMSRDGLAHLVGALAKKVVQVTFQEQALRSLVKIRDAVGESRFDHFLEEFHPQCKKDFDILCQVYDVQSQLGDSGIDLQIASGGDGHRLSNDGSMDTLDNGHGYWSEESSSTATTTPPFPHASSSDNSVAGRDQNQNLVLSDVKSSTDSSERVVYSAKRLPEDDQNSMDDEGVSQEYDEAGNESGGEASSEGESEEDEEARGDRVVLVKEHEGRLEKVTDAAGELVIDEDVLQSGKVILETEIKFSEETAITMTILEEDEEDPTPNRPSHPGSVAAHDSGDDDVDEGIYNNDFVMKVLTEEDDDNGMEESDEESMAPLRRTPRRVRFGGEMVVMRTPDSDAASGRPEEEDVLVVTKEEPGADNRPDGSRERQDAPEEVIEVKLQQATKARSSLIPLPISPARNPPKEAKASRQATSVPAGQDDRQAVPSLVHAGESGESLTSSGSDGDYWAGVAAEAGGSWEDLGIVSQQVLQDLYNKDDWCARVRGIEQLNLQLHQTDNLRRVVPRLPSLLHTLLVTLAEDRNHRVATGALGVARALQLSLSPHQLRPHLPQLVVGLARHIGGGGRVDVKIEAVQAAKVLMQAVRPGPVIDVLLSGSCVGAKSSKMRENSLLFLLYAAHTFPSTEFPWDAVAERVAQAAADPRRRVRQASLDALAVLSQFVAPRALDRCLVRAADRLTPRDVRDAFLAAVLARLARRQLPCVSQDGLILYALQIPASRCSGRTAFGGVPSAGPDVDWILAGSGSVSPGSARSRGQLIAAHRVDTVPAPREAPPIPGHGGDGMKARSSPWSNRKAADLSAVGVAYGRPQGPSNQVTWALVPVTTLPAYNNYTATDDQRTKGAFWSSDVSSSAPQILTTNQGSFRPVYLQFHNGPEPNHHHHHANDRGFSLLPSRVDGDHPWSTSLDGAARERLNQTWPPPSSTAAAAPGQEVRVLTPTQLRGRRVLQPIGVVDRPPDDLASSRAIPRRDPGSSGRYRMPSLTSPKRQVDGSGTTETARPPEISVQDLATSRSPERPRVRRRQQAPRPARDTHHDGTLRPDQASRAASFRRKGTPPLLVESAPAHDCTIPQKPVLVRQPVRLETPPDGGGGGGGGGGGQRRPQSDSSCPPPAEPFLPPVEAAAPRGRPAPAPVPLADELVFQSLDSFDREDAPSAHRRPPSPEQHVFSKSMPDYRSSVALDEERERNIKYRQLKDQEAERISVTPPSSASAPAAMSSAPEPETAEEPAQVIDLSPSTPESAPPTLMDVPPTRDPSPPPDPPVIKELAPCLPPVVELQLMAPGEEHEGAVPQLAATPTTRTRRSVIPRQLKRNSVAPAPVQPREPARSRHLAKQSNNGYMFPDTLKPVDKPRDSLQMYFHQLDSQEWEVVMQGLQTLVRLCRHHPDTVQAHLHAVLVALARQIRNLRSQVSRAACQAAGELFLALKRALESDLDEVVVPLFHRAADTNKFLRADSNAALDRMVEYISTSRAITAICCKGATHQHAIVRTAAARLLAGIVTKLGAERTMSLPRDTRDKILVTGANLLTEGSLDTRCFAKQMFRVLSSQHHFIFVMTEVVPPSVMRNIAKTLQALK